MGFGVDERNEMIRRKEVKETEGKRREDLLEKNEGRESGKEG